eukprot:TRINITY_DN11613_c0_g1_i1.p1 TRINITY_DN11613_c0_g1~~TRINITY_DN11613_c0_g1_i1.p1  ORF type:complete len:254 (-),score=45.33 TRINITY_DN11613_c0_g1_i1:46-711(-)
MAACRIVAVTDLRPSAEISEPLAFEITLDVAEPLAEDILFRCIFIQDASCSERDVELDSLFVGNGPGLQAGVMKFVLECPAPTVQQLEESGGGSDVVGIYLTATYRDTEFCRVGYYVRHEDPSAPVQLPPPQADGERAGAVEVEDAAPEEQTPTQQPQDWTKLRRVLSEPCVTRFKIGWDGPPPATLGETLDAEGEVGSAFEPEAKRQRCLTGGGNTLCVA